MRFKLHQTIDWQRMIRPHQIEIFVFHVFHHLHLQITLTDLAHDSVHRVRCVENQLYFFLLHQTLFRTFFEFFTGLLRQLERASGSQHWPSIVLYLWLGCWGDLRFIKFLERVKSVNCKPLKLEEWLFRFIQPIQLFHRSMTRNCWWPAVLRLLQRRNNRL